MELCPEEANKSSASQEILHTLWNTKVHYRIHKSPPPVSILSQIDPVCAHHPTSRKSISILSSHLCLGLPSGLNRSGFSTKTLYVPLLSDVRATCPVHLSLLDLITRIIYDEGTEHKAPFYVAFSTPPLPCPSCAQVSSSALYSRKPSAYVRPAL